MAEILQRTCHGTLVKYGSGEHDTATIALSPQAIRELMHTSEVDLLELPSMADPTVPAYIDRGSIIALTPMWGWLG